MRFKHLFLFGIILLLAACQKETPVETIPETTKQSNFQAKTVSAEEIPKVMDFLRSELESNSTRSLKGYELNLPFDESRIIEERINQIDDSESGITTYTFAVEKINDEAWVNNLLITENPDGSFQQISLIVFPFPDWFNIEYNLGNAKLEDFKGQILNYSLYDAIDDSKGIYNLEPCGTFDYGDPIGGNEDDYDCLTCTATGGISWSNVDVGSDDVTCHWESEWVEVQDFSGNTVSIFIVHFEVCVTTGEFFTGFDHCPDPNPVGPNDPNIDVDLTYEEIREITANKIISNTGITDPIFELTLLGDDELRSSLYSVIQSNSPEHVKAQEAYDIWIPYLIGKTAEYDIAIALLKRARDDNNHPDYINKSDFDLACSAAWSVLGDDLHTLLDVAGMVPGFGEPADLANAAIYTLEGDEVNASISLVALWPLGGQFATGTRLVFKVVKTASNRSAKLIFNRTASGLFEFCNDKKAGGIVNCRGQLARMFSYNKATHQAHHMIPWGKRNHPLIQKAAEGGLFHPNMKANGEILSKSVHNGNHPGYDSVIQSYFDSKFTANLNPEDAAEIVFDAIDQLKAQLKNGIPINNVVIN